MRGAQAHLAKLDRDKHGAYVAIQRELGEITGAIDDFPTVLSLKDQGRFSLGYYHQRNSRFNRKVDKDQEETA
jgi:CRISPR-associated protein Csd1